MKVATKVFLRRKKVHKFSFFTAYPLKQKRENATKAIYDFQRLSERYSTYFLVVIAVFLRIRTLKNRTLEVIILKQKRKSVIEVIYVFVILLECLFLVRTIYFLEVIE